MTLARGSGEALWLQIAASLSAEINAGTLAMNERLPSENELMARFGVARSTLRQALASLESRGLVRTEQGRGTFVTRRQLNYPISARTRFSRNLIEQGFDPTGEVLSELAIPAGPEVAARLRVPEWQTVAYRRALAKADGLPVALGDDFVALNRFPDFAKVRARHATYSATFADFGVRDYVRQSTQIEARMPSAEEAALLQQPMTSPVFVMTRVDADPEGRPILFGRGIWSSDRVVFDISAPT